MFNIKIGTISSKIHTPYEGMYQGGGTQEDKVVTGNGYVDLTKAVANKLIYLKLFGGTEQRNLPAGYTELDGITSQTGAYIVSTTDIANLTKVEIDVDINTAGSTTQWLFGKYVANSACSIEYAGSTGKIVCDLWSSTNRLAFNGTQTGRHLLELDVTDRTFTVDGTLIGTAGTVGVMAEGTYGLVGGFYGSFMSNNATYYGVKAWESNVLVYDLVPCKNANNEVGMYNLVNGQFMDSDGEGTFIAGNAVVPTPEHPVDIVSNNGVIKVRHQSGLPLGYTLLDYITADNGPYIDTGIKIASTDTVETEFANSSATGYGALYGVYKAGESSAFYANSTYYGYDVDNNKINTNVSVDTSWHKATHNFVDGTLTIDQTTVNFTPFTFANTDNNGLFTRMYNNVYGYFFKGSCKSHKIYRSGNLILNLIPAKDSSNNVGMYDLVSGHFFTNDGTGTFTYGQEVSDGLEFYTEGTIETVEDELGNTATAEMLLKVCEYQDEQEILSGNVITKIGVKVLDGTENWQNISGYINISKEDLGSSSAVMPLNSTNIVCSHFETKTGAFVDGIGVGGSYVNFRYDSLFTTVAQRKQYLADQYNAGTPVIVVYPLATSSTESVSGQTLNVKSGTNRIEITQASINNLGIEAKYTARQ